jgi:hypothetical protein
MGIYMPKHVELFKIINKFVHQVGTPRHFHIEPWEMILALVMLRQDWPCLAHSTSELHLGKKMDQISHSQTTRVSFDTWTATAPDRDKQVCD